MHLRRAFPHALHGGDGEGAGRFCFVRRQPSGAQTKSARGGFGVEASPGEWFGSVSALSYSACSSRKFRVTLL